MHPKFAEMAESLHPSFERLMAQPAWRFGEKWTGGRVAGVYLFSEHSAHLYVGRSNNVKARHGRHHRPSAHHGMASFAFRLAREETGQLRPAYTASEGSRKALAADRKFGAAFLAAKARIRAMDFRFVEEADPTRQCLLEVYYADTPYNDFDNH